MDNRFPLAEYTPPHKSFEAAMKAQWRQWGWDPDKVWDMYQNGEWIADLSNDERDKIRIPVEV